MYLSNTKTIVFITGAFISHSCWKEWIVFFEHNGYKTVAPPWPHKNDTAEKLRSANFESKISSLRLSELVDYYTEIIEQLPEKPILIGHSYGGLLTQLLLQKELGSVGVCINSFTPKGLVCSKFSFYKAIWKSMGFFDSTKKNHLLSFKNWQKNFSNTIPFEEQKNTYETFAIPESKLAIRDILTQKAKINFRKKHEPILFLASSNDKLVSSKLIYANFKRYKNFSSITCYKEFKEKNHLILIQSGWEDVALYIVDWLPKVTN